MSWTEERVTTLKKLWEEGLSASQIAAQLGGVSRNAVIGKVHRLKLSGRGKTVVPTSTIRKTPTAKTTRTRVNLNSKATPVTSEESFIVEKEAPTFQENLCKKKQPLEPVVEVEIEVQETETPLEQRLGLLQLTEMTCKWPVGDPLAEDFYFCGAKAAETSPYCSYHSKVAFQPISERRRKAS